ERVMYLSRVSFSQSLATRDFLKYLSQNKYSEHQALWELFDFDPRAKRDFLFHKIEKRRKPKYYVLSKRPPLSGKKLWHIDGPKKYDPCIREGQVLSFVLRINPVVTVQENKREKKNAKSKRVDILTYKKMQMNYRELPFEKKIPPQQLIQEGCLEWLEKRSENNGFIFKKNEVIIGGYQKNRAWSKNKSIVYNSADIMGRLTVCDEEKFKTALYEGIGRGRAFGCGLLLVKKI
ncbi:MAG: type I-E CRISPR-associated protein Cas6/Cse3/CasE, partial [Bacteriovoracales bacterium]|nr:type I-E CRISPR-associated protein Cas6/Cse3/CasE [Bacteriovoracales bacterium]